MDTLRNLQEIYNSVANKFNQYRGEDFVLPQVFKDQVKEINSNVISYNKYSAVIETRGNQNGVLNIYLPNQWFYIASYFTDFYRELLKYKRCALKVASKERLKDLNGAILTDSEQNAVKELDIDEQSQEYLIKFITDYSWWYGAKTIDRGDFFVSPILNSAKLVNASQSFVADLCAFLADKEDLVKVIMSGYTPSETLIKKELVRQKAAATFMKKAMQLTLEKDLDLNRLAALNKYEKTSKQLKINGFFLGRNKNQPPTRIDDIYEDVSWMYDSVNYVLYLEWTPDKMEKRFFPVYNEAYNGMLKMEKDSNGEYVLYEYVVSLSGNTFEKGPLQQIFYGAPGTGKSHTINETTKLQPTENVFRTTFHPDSDYSTFVGCYKPTTLEVPMRDVTGKIIKENGADVTENRIVYKFVAQAFIKAYLRAWQTKDPVFLVIEEINRGNCAQIFGDLFQLLDRKDGVSEYPIKADNDLAVYIGEELAKEAREDIPENVKSGEELVLPSNLYIWATMNTSDQSLFPIDSAFKRRWDWAYIPIDTKKESWNINADGVNYEWSDFLEKINAKIESATSSEDKMLGFYFCKAENGTITAEKFVNKVVFYLWNDVFKDYGFDDAVFNDENNEKLTFRKFYTAERKVDESKVKRFLENLGVKNDKTPEPEAQE